MDLAGGVWSCCMIIKFVGFVRKDHCLISCVTVVVFPSPVFREVILASDSSLFASDELEIHHNRHWWEHALMGHHASWRQSMSLMDADANCALRQGKQATD